MAKTNHDHDSFAGYFSEIRNHFQKISDLVPVLRVQNTAVDKIDGVSRENIAMLCREYVPEVLSQSENFLRNQTYTSLPFLESLIDSLPETDSRMVNLFGTLVKRINAEILELIDQLLALRLSSDNFHAHPGTAPTTRQWMNDLKLVDESLTKIFGLLQTDIIERLSFMLSEKKHDQIHNHGKPLPMKTILVCTDFSEGSHNAVRYAAQMARAFQTKLIVFHVYYPNAENPSSSDENFLQRQLELSASALRSLVGHDVEPAMSKGVPVKEIIAAREKYNAGLIITGSRETAAGSGLVGGLVFDLIHAAVCPVLAVPLGASFKPMKKIALAYNLENRTSFDDDMVRRLVNFFNAELELVSIISPGEEPGVAKAVAAVELEHRYGDTIHKLQLVEDESLVQGLVRFASGNEIDLIAITPHQHNLFSRMLRTTSTQKVLRSTKVPLLSLPLNQI